MIKDLSKLCFLPGSLLALKDGKYNYISLLKQGLTNLGVEFPSSDGGGGAFVATFSESIPFNRDYTLMDYTVTGPLILIPNTTGRIIGGTTYLRLVADGVNTPTFDNLFIITSGSYDNTDGVVNRLIFYWNGSEYEVSITQLIPYVAPTLIPITFTSVTNITESPSGTWRSTINTGDSYGQTGLSSKYLPASTNGIIYSKASATVLGAVFGFNTANSQSGWAGFEAAYVISTSLYPIDNGILGSPIVFTVNDLIGIRRTGSALTLEKSNNNGSSWTVIYTYSFTSTAPLYIVTDMVSGPTFIGTLVNPIGIGII